MPTLHGQKGGVAPLPFEMKSLHTPSGQFVSHAIIKCCVPNCGEIGKFPCKDALNVQMIVKRFERSGWEVYRYKARCPTHAFERAKQKAHFAKKTEEEAKMPIVQMPPKPTQIREPAESSEGELLYLLVIGPDGAPTVRPLEGVQSMLFGDKEYLVVPR
jgi:hypothetical protein